MASHHFWRLAGAAVGCGAAAGWLTTTSAALSAETTTKKRDGVLAAIGSTPLIELSSLSRATGCRILAKCEHLNPGGSVKDRAALWMIEDAEKRGLLKPGGTVCEGTGGNTGVGLALVSAAKGYKSIMAMPETISAEKIEAMRTYGATVVLCPPVPFVDRRHYFHTARAAAANISGGFFTNQFENRANLRAHLEGTGPEIWAQAGGRVDGFICSAGTGGTIAGCSLFLKAVNPDCQCWLVDPPGSALRPFVEKATAAGEEMDIEGFKVRFIERSPGSSITEGIGIGRLTGNFMAAAHLLDGALSCSDKEAVAMAFHLKKHDGVFVGPSAALNVVGAVKLAKRLGPGHTVVTVLCDSGRAYSRKYSTEFLGSRGLLPAAAE